MTTRHRTLADMIRTRRAELELSMRELAAKAGIDATLVFKLEHGANARGRVKMPNLLAVLSALGIKAGSPEHAEAIALWTQEHTPLATHQEVAPALTSASRASDRNERSLIAAVLSVPREDWQIAEHALRNWPSTAALLRAAALLPRQKR